MILYVNGDSNSSGQDLDSIKNSWPVHLSEKLKMSLVNQSKAGASNPSILRTTKNFLSLPSIENIFVIIGWTSWEREEWLFQNRYYNVNAGGHDVFPVELQQKYKNWVIEQGELAQYTKSKLLHNEIYQLHTTLQLKNIPHLFFNALMPFQHEVLGDPSQGKDWNNCFLYPYLNDYSYYWYLKKQGFVPTVGNHHLDSAQQNWAEVLINYIKEHKLL
jgi:hypothetical protein